MVLKKIAHRVTGHKIEFEAEFISNVTLNKKTLKCIRRGKILGS